MLTLKLRFISLRKKIIRKRGKGKGVEGNSIARRRTGGRGRGNNQQLKWFDYREKTYIRTRKCTSMNVRAGVQCMYEYR